MMSVGFQWEREMSDNDFFYLLYKLLIVIPISETFVHVVTKVSYYLTSLPFRNSTLVDVPLLVSQAISVGSECECENGHSSH